MIEYRITKYDPAKRNEQGRYLDVEEWTEFCDVGKIVTLEEYEQVEAPYIKTAIEFLSSTSITKLNIVDFEDYQNRNVRRENESIGVGELENELRSLLRGDFWCKLESELGYVHVGYDFYMYVGVSSLKPGMIEQAKSRGLFVEEFTSPYHPDDC